MHALSGIRAATRFPEILFFTCQLIDIHGEKSKIVQSIPIFGIAAVTDLRHDAKLLATYLVIFAGRLPVEATAPLTHITICE